MFVAGHMGTDEFRVLATQGIEHALSKYDDRYQFSDERWKFNVRQALLSMLVEEYVSCRFRVVPVLPAKFDLMRKFTRHESSIFAYDSCEFYHLYSQIRKILEEEFAERSCELFDFNDGLRWKPMD